ncbi:hypothetical protein [Streptomyces sp. SPB162]|uniref:hypothetical protein n=1 Tax=Streptomyces sp. SPB162 TaxID=2940560 RepID=UPI00240761B4|nr:hypothetical protein [Streptomyces sp. SPB162]MDF9817126.1 hypothetical protein [Streptomyces sp. SPB162]
MGWEQAALWGLAGGLATGLLSLTAAVIAADYQWPWTRRQLGPRLFVVAGGLLLGALVAAAAHGQMSGGWPAFVMGAGAPATIRGLLAGLEVETPGEQPSPSTSHLPASAQHPAASREPRDGGVSEGTG